MSPSLGVRLRQQCHILTLAVLLKSIFEEELVNKPRRLTSIPDHELSNNVYLEKILSVVQ